MNLGKESETLEFKKTTGELRDSMDDVCAQCKKQEPTSVFNLRENTLTSKGVEENTLTKIKNMFKKLTKRHN